MDTTTHTTSTAAKAATQEGALAGFSVTCAACAFTATNTVRTNAEADGREHERWANAQPNGRTR